MDQRIYLKPVNESVAAFRLGVAIKDSMCRPYFPSPSRPCPVYPIRRSRHNRVRIYSMNLPLQSLRTKTKILSSPLQQIHAIKWNIRLRELSKPGQYQQAITLYRQMLRFGATPNAFTFPFILKSSAALSLPVSGAQIHCHVIKSGCQSEPFVQTALITMYCKCWSPDTAYKLFDESPKSWELTVCYNALISGYVQDSQFSNGLLLFREMRSRGVAFNAVTVLWLVPGCTVPTHLKLGMSLHCSSLKCGLNSDLAVANCFLTMYVRCGSFELARKLFDEIPMKGLITWNAMISGCAQNGLGTEVLDRMLIKCGYAREPNHENQEVRFYSKLRVLSDHWLLSKELALEPRQ
ncbi:putative pentatricopeptide repeat-containing protein At3g11460, mitochondrial [Olea europaea var. sylvestris]|uniref:putative pentatricopeptide repeat-containing protein At3g11460, mitochondrial n=1 Tax=Olea europaea var. sylvestris TaxID=158386 RepID=UPI000C1D6B99|nr:putative pentatricopeptide repeat-containing protein At3g11460, mitochondrial [Olea europaea var. sylvestris]